MDLVVAPDGSAVWDGRRMRCALGRSGIRIAKREGDGATPAGTYALRQVLYRPDRVPPPPTLLPVRALRPSDGWCDAPADAAYNRPVQLPYPGRAEALWRADAIYDLVVVLGYNDDPVTPGLGSAIFLHLARTDFAATEGCIALAHDDLASVIAAADGGSRVVVAAPA
jgi:L,D-peptidoglycan transpeptidase YkuD (ErfK/YbiS/YcfS/YnhG family)